MAITSSIDKTCKLWDLRGPEKSLKTITDHTDQVASELPVNKLIPLESNITLDISLV